jgi:hypothetical protein
MIHVLRMYVQPLTPIIYWDNINKAPVLDETSTLGASSQAT